MGLEQRLVLAEGWVRLYDEGVREVYGYLLHRCGNAELAQDLTSDTFLTVARAAAGAAPVPSMAWLITVARSRLIDHFRRAAVEERVLRAISGAMVRESDALDVRFEHGRAMDVLHTLSGQHRAVLTLRYLDGLSLAETARILERTDAATQALLARAKAEFRRRYNSNREDRANG